MKQRKGPKDSRGVNIKFVCHSMRKAFQENGIEMTRIT